MDQFSFIPVISNASLLATENGTWDTSKALVRRTIERCVHHGRLHRAQGHKEDEYEAYRLLGQLVCCFSGEFGVAVHLT